MRGRLAPILELSPCSCQLFCISRCFLTSLYSSAEIYIQGSTAPYSFALADVNTLAFPLIRLMSTIFYGNGWPSILIGFLTASNLILPCATTDWIYWRKTLQSLVLWDIELWNLQYFLFFNSLAHGIVWFADNWSYPAANNMSKIWSAFIMSNSYLSFSTLTQGQDIDFLFLVHSAILTSASSSS